MLGAPVVVIPATLPYVEPKSEHIKVQKENDEKYKEDNKPKPPKDLTS
jgi:hypothetical protein